ncbi:hypothetical protein ANTQUA_LOCUS6248 [Anthophora quadrimaculata]
MVIFLYSLKDDSRTLQVRTESEGKESVVRVTNLFRRRVNCRSAKLNNMAESRLELVKQIGKSLCIFNYVLIFIKRP